MQTVGLALIYFSIIEIILALITLIGVGISCRSCTYRWNCAVISFTFRDIGDKNLNWLIISLGVGDGNLKIIYNTQLMP